MQAVDAVVQANGVAGTTAAEGVLGKLPPELVALLDQHRELLAALIEVWRKTPADGGRTSAAFLACVKVWKAATGAITTANTWEALWKGMARPRK